jgi:mono/diheme cytochrome c family protein
MVDGVYVERIPVPLTRATLEEGQRRYHIFCAPCHGGLGDGVSVVAHNMELRKPPSFIAEPIASYPAGRIYGAIANGYGLMPTYSQELNVMERWSVVGYVRTLQRRAGVPLDELPEPIRQRALQELP